MNSQGRLESSHWTLIPLEIIRMMIFFYYSFLNLNLATFLVSFETFKGPRLKAQKKHSK